MFICQSNTPCSFLTIELELLENRALDLADTDGFPGTGFLFNIFLEDWLYFDKELYV